MLKIIDRIFGCLLVLASCGHTVGTILWTKPMSGMFIWSLGAALAGLLLGALNIVRAGRPEDRTLAVITSIGTACWGLVTFGFGKSIGNIFDPRPLGHVIISMVLVIFGLITITRANSAAERPIRTHRTMGA